MNSRERIQAALAHKEPDRVPIDFNGHRSSGIMAHAYVKLREFLGLPPSELYVYDFIQQLALVEDDVLDIVGADVVEVGHDYWKFPEYWQDWNLPDGTPCKIPAFCQPVKKGKDWVVYGFVLILRGIVKSRHRGRTAGNLRSERWCLVFRADVLSSSR